jgi:hypothetical protein
MAPLVPVLPHQARHRALAELDALIARAERDHAAYLALAERAAAVGGDARMTQARERFARERVEGLRRSREVLVNGDEGRQGAS